MFTYKGDACDYCCEDIRLIENYEKAVFSKERYVCHHRREDEGYSKQQLIDMGCYYGVPAKELIFMSATEHRIHHTIGSKNPFYGKKQKRETIEAQRAKQIKNNLQGKAVFQYSKKLKFIRYFFSASEAGRKTGFDRSGISRACRDGSVFGGCLWFYDPPTKFDFKPLF